MANKLYSTLYTGNYPVLLAKQMVYEEVDQSFWGRWAKFNGPNRKPLLPSQKGQMLKNTPIVIQNELQGRQGDVMEIPMHRYLRKKPVVSGGQLISFEEQAKINHCEVPVDLFRHAEEPYDSSIMRQVTKELDLVARARPSLQTHYSQCEEFLGLLYAFYNAFSWHVLRGKAFFNDTRFKETSHPHIYFAGSGKVSGIPGTAAYEQNIHDDLVTLKATPQKFDTGFLDALRSDQQLHRIRPLHTEEGNEFWCIVVHDWQLNDLRQDSAFREIEAAAMVQQMAKNNAYLVGAKYFYNGFAIWSHSNSCWPVNVNATADGVIYGPFVDTYNFDVDGDLDYFRGWTSYDGGTTPNDAFGAILFGDNFMYRGLVRQPEFLREYFDYDETLGIAYRCIDGYSRGDFWNRDDGTLGQYLVNDGSLLLITSATAPTY